MQMTTVHIKTNKYKNGFYQTHVNSFGGDFFGHIPSSTVEAFNRINNPIVGEQHYIDGTYIEILSIEKRDI